MAFDFNGTFTRSQFERFERYLKDQLALVEDRIIHLEAEIERVGNLGFAFDSGGVPTELATDPKGNPPPPTYVGKLFSAYEALGGDAFFDLQVRSSGQAVFLVSGDETRESQQMSNGEIIGRRGLSDANSASLMTEARQWVEDDLDRRRNFLERKIRRALDYSDQLQTEVNTLRTILEDKTVDGSLAFLLAQVQALIADRQYRAITDDSNQSDPHGKFAKAPFAAYEPGGLGAEPQDFERTLDGLSRPGVVPSDVGGKS